MTTTIPKLSAKDFMMMMDVHEPFSTDDIEKINPQAAMDKTVEPVEDQVRDDASVDSTGARCEVCFGPMPCAAHANVEQWDGVTSLSISPATILVGTHNADLECVVVVGMTKDGAEYFASSHSDAAESIFYLQRGIHKLNRIIDGEEVERVRKDPA